MAVAYQSRSRIPVDVAHGQAHAGTRLARAPGFGGVFEAQVTSIAKDLLSAKVGDLDELRIVVPIEVDQGRGEAAPDRHVLEVQGGQASQLETRGDADLFELPRGIGTQIAKEPVGTRLFVRAGIRGSP